MGFLGIGSYIVGGVFVIIALLSLVSGRPGSAFFFGFFGVVLVGIGWLLSGLAKRDDNGTVINRIREQNKKQGP